MNHRTKYLGQISFSSKVVIWTETDTHIGTIAVPGPLKSLVITVDDDRVRQLQ